LGAFDFKAVFFDKFDKCGVGKYAFVAVARVGIALKEITVLLLGRMETDGQLAGKKHQPVVKGSKIGGGNDKLPTRFEDSFYLP
jgi:hypothetical protein